jgi:zinc protease
VRRLPPALALASLLAVFASAATATVPEVRAPIRYTLPNGMRVVLDPIANRTTTAVVIGVNAGRRDQPPGWSGLAHLTEHLLFQGTPAAPGETISRLERLGASEINGETTDDETRYYEVVPSSQLEHTLWLEAERFAHGLDGLDEASVAEQRRVVDREREVRDLGREEVEDLLISILYPEGHPYGRAREERDDVHAVRLDDVRWFFQRFYAPDMLTVSISGGFEPDRVRGWIERYFGPLARGAIARPAPWQPPPPVPFEGERRVLAEANRSNDALQVLWPSPPWGAPGDAELDFVARELERRLEQRLVRSGTALHVRVRQGSRPLASTFSVWVEVPRGSGTLGPLQALDRELAELREQELDDATMRSFRRSWIAGDLITMDDSLTRAQRNSRRLPSFPGGHYDLGANLRRYDAVAASSVREAARRHLPPGHRLVVSLASRRDAPSEGRVVTDMMVGGGSE